ncbi:MAG: hypothetical protein KAJ51_16565, partial [Thermoplasmata archaeon]|nr:hypothetical protein [Thermoplasmata archaeon]
MTINKKNKTGKKDSDEKDNSRSGYNKKLNIFLVFLIIVSLLILAIRFQDIITNTNNNGSDDDNGDGGDGNGNGNGNNNTKIQSIIPLREAGIINGHEHIQDKAQVNKWLAAMDRAGVSTTVILGSPDATFWLHPSGPFEKYKDNNEELLQMVGENP